MSDKAEPYTRPINRACLSYWFRKIGGVVPVPKTEMWKVGTEHRDAMIEALNCKTEEPSPEVVAAMEGLAKIIIEGAQQVQELPGVSPVFLRAGLTNARREWKRACYVHTLDVDSVCNHLVGVAESSVADEYPIDVLAVREFLTGEDQFRAFGGNMPIRREFRCFVRDSNVCCIHPYWPANAILLPTDGDLRERLERMNTLSDRDRKDIEGIASLAGRLLEGFWSVDMLHARGQWYVTDCAPGEESYHVEGCTAAD